MTRETQYHVAELLVVGLIFHLIFIGSVFDCYFTSPVVHGMQHYNAGPGESQRLVLIVADGLRADLFFEKNGFPHAQNSPQVVAPYLRSILETRGAFGVSHTRVPTESRPGHVAIIGGMYEDVSAVTKGWKTNPVDFDSVFNQSRTTFSFGSPDILPMFAKGATPGTMMTWSYNEEDEDFTKDATALDIWVLDHLRSLFRNATTDSYLNAQLRSDKVVFFLHLLGLDTTGHSYRPHSPEYLNNIRVVDDVVRQVEAQFSEFYDDQDTSFIFTADHGMSVIGNHGDGHPDSTRTPLVAWGKGVRGPVPDSIPTSHDSYSNRWGLNHLFRRDVEQADLAPLMASLVGIDWPVNSVGVLPDADPSRPGYILPKNGNETLARAALVNAKVLLEHYRVKHVSKQEHTFFYQPFLPLEGLSGALPRRIQDIKNIEQNIEAGDWYLARRKASDLVRSALQGLHYLETYQRTLIRYIVTFAYTGWAAYASLYVFRPMDSRRVAETSLLRSAFTACTCFSLAVFWAVFAVERAPWTYSIYVAFPLYFWHQFFTHASQPILSVLRSSWRAFDVIKLLLQACLVVAALLAMVFGYTHRFIWSIGFVLIGVVWPVVYWSKDVRRRLGANALLWGISCLITAIFPLLDVNKTESLTSIWAGGILIIAMGALGTFGHVRRADDDAEFKKRRQSVLVLFGVQSSLVIAAMIITRSSVISLQAKTGLPIFNQVLGWLVLVTASTIPFVMRVKHENISSKLLTYFLGFGPCFVILSISVEGLFYVFYSSTLFHWITVEQVFRCDAGGSQKSSNTNTYHFQPDDLRVAIFFLFFVQVGFFGTGNVASISSFYLSPVYRLIPVFDPSAMAALLIFKIIAPYVILSVAFAAVNYSMGLPPFSLFLVAVMLTDVMTLTFFFNVLDTGSWLEIGQTISFFCITSLLSLFSGGLCAGGEYLMRDVLPTRLQTRVHVE